jgi:hypothetical protein
MSGDTESGLSGDDLKTRLVEFLGYVVLVQVDNAFIIRLGAPHARVGAGPIIGGCDCRWILSCH